MKQNVIETIVGFIIIAIAAVFFKYSYETGKSSPAKKGYIVQASFQNVEGISEGSDVMVAGIKVGSVESLVLDNEDFFALARLRINEKVKLPKDSRAAIVTSGFLGGKFISITPGAADEDLAANDQIKYTQSSVNIESLISKFMYSSSSK